MPTYQQQTDPMMQQYLQQQQMVNAATGAGAASTSSNALQSSLGIAGLAGLGGQVGGQLGALINSGNPNNVGQTGIGQGINTGLDLASLIPGPQQIPLAVMTALAPFIESFIPQGVPRDAKTQSIANALSGSPNQLQGLLGGLLNRGLQSNHVLSESGPNTLGGATERTASMLEALTGQQIPGVKGTGDFQHDPSLAFTKLFKAVNAHGLPAGYEFVNDPQGINTAFNDINKMVGVQAPTSSAGSAGEWQRLMQQLMSQHVLQRYKGPLGAPAPQSALGGGGIPNIGAPHPFQQQQTANAPYPV